MVFRIKELPETKRKMGSLTVRMLILVGVLLIVVILVLISTSSELAPSSDELNQWWLRLYQEIGQSPAVIVVGNEEEFMDGPVEVFEVGEEEADDENNETKEQAMMVDDEDANEAGGIAQGNDKNQERLPNDEDYGLSKRKQSNKWDQSDGKGNHQEFDVEDEDASSENSANSENHQSPSKKRSGSTDDDSAESDASTSKSKQTSDLAESSSLRGSSTGGASTRKSELLPKECSTSRRKEHPGIGRNSPRVQYIHVPKAGGTSIQDGTVTWVRQSRGRASLYKYDSNSVRGSSVKCPLQALDVTVLTGHRGFGYCYGVENEGLFTFTALRGPVARVVSWYDYYLYDLREPRAVAVFGSEEATLSELVKRYDSTTEKEEYGEKLLRYAGQQQARFLCGYECMGPMARGNKNYTELFILERALENLKKLDAIGLVEKLNDMIVQLRFHLPQLVPRTFKEFRRFNTNMKKRSVLDEEAEAIVRRWAWVDATLYEEATRLYEEKQRIAETCIKGFETDLEDEVEGEQDNNDLDGLEEDDHMKDLEREKNVRSTVTDVDPYDAT